MPTSGQNGNPKHIAGEINLSLMPALIMDIKQLGNIVGVIALIVVIYRIIFIFTPQFQKALAAKDTGRILRAFTLLV